MKRVCTIVFIMLIMTGLTACSKKTELVWLVADPEFVELRQEVLNEYLEEIGADYTVMLESFIINPNNIENIEDFDEGEILTYLDYEIYTEKVLDMKTSGAQVDILFIPLFGTGDEYVTYAELDLLGPLDPYLFQNNNESEVYKEIHELVWESLDVNGNIYGITNSYIASTDNTYAYSTYYMDKYEISEEVIAADLVENAELIRKVMKAENNEIAGVVMWSMLPEHFPFYYLDESRAIGITAEGKVVNMYEQEETLAYLSDLKELKDSGYLYFPNYDGYEIFNSEQSFFGITYGHTYLEKTTTYMEHPAEIMETIKTELLIVPGTVLSEYGYHMTNFLVNSIASWSEQKELAFEFLNLLYTDRELANLIAYGVEGTDYEQENGMITYAYRTFNDYTSDIYTYAIDRQPANKEEMQNLYYETGGDNVVRGFRFDSTQVEQEMAAVNAVIYNDENGWYTELVESIDYLTAENLEETLAEICRQLEEAGIQKIIDEAQKQLDSKK